MPPIVMALKNKLYCFTKYSTAGPSSRYRTFQYLQAIQESFEVIIQAGFGDWYFDKKIPGWKKKWFLFSAFLKRLFTILLLPTGSVVWIEYELFPYLPAFAEGYLRLRKIAYCVDYDDAIFHNYDQSSNGLIKRFLSQKIPYVMRNAKTVVTGSPYLTQFALAHNPSVVEIPTSIHFSKYLDNQEVLPEKKTGCLVIGWIGSTSTSPNVLMLREPLKKLAEKTNAELWLMGFDMKLAAELKGLPVRFFAWAQDKEVPFLNSIDIGVMPLSDIPFNHGKCGFKLIQYMAAGKPTISTPLDANKKINRNGLNKYAEGDDCWLTHIIHFASHPDERKSIGKNNRELVQKFYSLEANYATLIQVLTTMGK